MSVKERILLYQKERNLTITETERLCGLGRNSFRNSNNIGSEAVATFLYNNPNLSAEWLMRGKGEMLRVSKEEFQEKLAAIAAEASGVHLGQSNIKVVGDNNNTGNMNSFNGGTQQDQTALLQMKDDMIAQLKDSIEEYKERVRELKERIQELKNK